ncbi:hypothetical protein I862_03025 [endosymbiont of Acanthamoeba sp. UWC8]|uniref:hypothetical protein n=1 Tax=endosymbiont of Acanthamoeba sp. UWC8 TaxID=86106 RepID=UPI0004D0F4E1|nr:hypothetical protein [endosymbiont of Acanthamoeba sp. UWC8]AIF81166.1 hypothetical protein I862_03025 [endosymbiont of Acanthamoeba sp. UWC8]
MLDKSKNFQDIAPADEEPQDYEVAELLAEFAEVDISQYKGITPTTTEASPIDLNSPYLDLGIKFSELKEHEKVVMAMAPLNSSGDIYHMLAFTILSKHHKKLVPKILLTHDKDANKEIFPESSKLNTGDQVRRALSFVNTLGYKDYFEALRIDNSAHYANIRQGTLEEVLEEKEYKYYIDHRLSTTIISNHFDEHGFDKTTNILRDGFKKWEKEYIVPPQIKGRIYFFVDHSLRNINYDINPKNEEIKKPTIIFHTRYSAKANYKQSSFINVLNNLASSLQERYNIITIHADNRKNKEGKIKNSIANIYPFMYEISDEQDYSKLAHLRLLTCLYENRDKINLHGIIGTTSGTLDLAAFIGHKVLNIHQVTTPFNYQDYRLFMQSTFLSIQALCIKELRVELFNEECELWLSKQPANNIVCLPIKGIGNIDPEDKEFILLRKITNINNNKEAERQSFVERLEKQIIQRLSSAQQENTEKNEIVRQ